LLQLVSCRAPLTKVRKKERKKERKNVMSLLNPLFFFPDGSGPHADCDRPHQRRCSPGCLAML
jgi:hypothetical protein